MVEHYSVVDNEELDGDVMLRTDAGGETFTVEELRSFARALHRTADHALAERLAKEDES